MDKLLESITHKCLRENLIDEGQTEWLLYSLQCRVMNIGGAGCAASTSAAFEFGIGFFAQTNQWSAHAYQTVLFCCFARL